MHKSHNNHLDLTEWVLGGNILHNPVYVVREAHEQSELSLVNPIRLGWAKKKPEELRRSCCPNHESYCVLTGGGRRPEHTSQRSQPFAENTDMMPNGNFFFRACPFNRSRTLCQIGRMLASFYWTARYHPMFGLCVLGLKRLNLWA